jgi:hypothetical protein
MVFHLLIVYVKAGSFLKLIEVGILSGVKFLIAPLLSFQFGYNYLQTVVITTIGGIFGVFFFFYLSSILLRLFRRYWPYVKAYFSNSKIHPQPLHIAGKHKLFKVKTTKYFSKKNKFIVMTKRKYGLWGIAALTPVLLSIPLGTFLANKYYRNKKSVLFSLTISVICWSLIMSSFYLVFRPAH